MPFFRKKKPQHYYADKFYDYVIERKQEILRYISAALVTGLIQFFLKNFFSSTGYGILVPFLIRFTLLFVLSKYWVYREIGTGAFYTGRQLMLYIMIITVSNLIFNYLTIFIVGLFPRPILVNYIIQALAEIFYFVMLQFFVFKEPKNN